MGDDIYYYACACYHKKVPNIHYWVMVYPNNACVFFPIESKFAVS